MLTQTVSPNVLSAKVSFLQESIELLFGEKKQDSQFDIDGFLDNLPEYSGEAFIAVNNNAPLFTAQELQSFRGIEYSELDELGRCGTAMGLIGPETLPLETRGAIGEVKPTGWHTVRYDDRIEDRYLYNRCHLIGYQLAGENAEPRNLITGTRYLNMTGMLPIENAVWSYVTETGNHVLYRVSPVFVDNDLVASGVMIEACSIEDDGAEIQLFGYLFNVQPGVVIDYRTGDSWADDSYEVPMQGDESETVILTLSEPSVSDEASDRSLPCEDTVDDLEITYILNTNTLRFHELSCPSIDEMKEKNRAPFSGTREEAIEMGYKPCGRCAP